MDKDLFGNATTDVERQVADLYAALKSLCENDDAPPCVARNARKALACLWQAANDLDLFHEHLYDLGV